MINNKSVFMPASARLAIKKGEKIINLPALVINLQSLV